MTEQLRLRRTGQLTGDCGVQTQGHQTVLPVVLVDRAGLDQDETHVSHHAKGNESEMHESVRQFLYVHFFEALFDSFETVNKQNDEGILEFRINDDV